ncbi:MAG: THUMP domain-containing protein [Chitinophagales bacterium]
MNPTPKTFELIAKTFHGLEETLAQEIRDIGGKVIAVQTRAVLFETDLKGMYRANLELRTALRILKPIHTFRAYKNNQLYSRTQLVNWSDYMDVDDTIAIDSVVSSQYFKHSKYVALKVKDAIVDQFREKTGSRPSVDTDEPTLRMHVYIKEQEVTLLLDASGDSLHRRGYRLEQNEAPLNEVLAAGLVLLSGWRGETPFFDPMCGSGTIPIEALMIARRIAPQLQRDYFGFLTWKDFDQDLWEGVLKEAEDRIIPCDQPIFGADISEKTLDIAVNNIERAGLEDEIELLVGDFFEQSAPFEEGGCIIMNPPYGERLQPEDIEAFYKEIGNQFKHSYTGWEAWVLSGNIPALKRLGLRASRRIPLFNGPLECRLYQFQMYKGSKKREEE